MNRGPKLTLFVQETKQDYCGFTVEFKSDHLFVGLKLSIVVGDASDRHNTVFSSPDRMCMCSSGLYSYV